MIKESSSFRDPSGYVFTENGILYRRVNPCYEDEYRQLMDSGLYKELVSKKLLIPHVEVRRGLLKPEVVGFISYPYEWSFSMLKDAALTTLEIQRTALGYGMVLKDASSYNIQFHNGRSTLIDTLSFGEYVEGSPWIAYSQFCRHFLNPLLLMSYRDIRLGQLLRVYIDGLPPDLTAKLLPRRTYLRPALLMHVHALSLGARRGLSGRLKTMSGFKLTALIDHLESTIKGLKWRPKGGWSEYKGVTNYSEESLNIKRVLVRAYLDRIKPTTVWDLGANLGEFSSIASEKARVISFDNDPTCVELSYLSRNGSLPLLLDLTNPSPSIGWDNTERKSLKERGPADTILALALVHHLAIGNNLPLGSIARFLSEMCHYLVIEFVPKEDSQVQKMLSTREDIFTNYNEIAFREEFGRYFRLLDSTTVEGTVRALFLMERL